LPHKIKTFDEVLFCVDWGDNMFVGNNQKYFSCLAMKKVDIELGTSTVGYFEGVGIIIVSIPAQVSEIFVLYPAFYSSSDKHCTISTGALKSSAGFSL
jgi:hypothetical protein